MADAVLKNRRNVVALRLAPASTDGAMISHLEDLLTCAQNGELVGVLTAAVFAGPDHCFVTNVHGICARRLTHARGMLLSLDDKLSFDFDERDPAEVR